jgi:hypothetical protein
VRGFNKVRGEWSLMALCYNFTCVLNILGFERFMACIAKALRWVPSAVAALLNSIQTALSALWASSPPPLAVCR